MKKGLFFSLVLNCFLIFSCGGGGGGSSSSLPSTPTTPTVTQTHAGFWIGTFTSNVLHSTYDVTGLIAETGLANFASTSTLAQYSGVISVIGNSNSFSGNVTAYAPVGETFPDGSTVGIVSVSGTFTGQGAISGTYSGVGDSGTFSLTYSGLYNRPSSFAAIAGTWEGPVQVYTNTVTVGPSGNIIGSSTAGCSYSGNVGIIDPTYFAYNVNFSIINCGLESGTYIGLAALTDTVTANDTLLIEVSDPSFSFVASLTRQ